MSHDVNTCEWRGDTSKGFERRLLRIQVSLSPRLSKNNKVEHHKLLE